MRTVALLVFTGCASAPPPPREDTALLARIAALEGRVDDLQRERTNLVLRIAALEASGGKRVPDADVAARVAGYEAKIAALEDRIALLEAARNVDEAKKPVTVIEPKRRLPAPGEVVKPLAAIDGESFSFVREGNVELARLAGIEVPSEWDAAKVRARLEELLTSGDLSFEYPAEHLSGKAVLVYAKAGATAVNETLLREGLAVARGEHERKADFEKLEAEAREAKRGFFAR